MKASKTLIIKFESWENFKRRTGAALKARKSSIGRKEVFIFASVAEYQKFMTEQKLAILAAILHKRPTSIYRLAQLVERDFANVQRDCVALEGMGFIKLEESKNSKKSKVPRLAFPYTKILIQMPSIRYCHDLDEAA